MDPTESNESSSAYNTPSRGSSSSSQPWSFDNAPVESSTPTRPQASRHSSLPRALYTPTSSSIFGSGGRSLQRDASATTSSLSLDTAPRSSNVATNLMDSVQRAPTTSITGHSGERWLDDEEPTPVDRRIPRVEKDADDPTSPVSATRGSMSRQGSTTSTRLSKLFAVRTSLSPDESRSSSYTQASNPYATYTRNLPTTEVAGLPDHLYTRGLLEGRHSDITVTAFGHPYKLHRLVLDRAPFFRSALNEPWVEANAKETSVHPEDIDPSITQHAFELALKRLYGCGNFHEEEREAVGLFATGCWLEMQDLIDSSIESILRQMTPDTLSPLIKLVTSKYYGRAGGKILASAKSMLCRDGWKMPLKCWDGIPADIIREIVGGDGFYIDGEWDRWILAKRILDRMLKVKAIKAGLVDRQNRRKVQKAPDTTTLLQVRCDAAYRRPGSSSGRTASEYLQRWISIYTDPEIDPILVLLDEGIHYVHLDFEHLQFIRRTRDIFGVPVVPEKVISSALWQQMELRQKVVNARDDNVELDLSLDYTEDTATVDTNRDTTMSMMSYSSPQTGAGKGKHKVMDEADDEKESLESESWDATSNGKPRKFWIPMTDCNIVMGGNGDPIIATSSNPTIHRHASRLSATLRPEDVQLAVDFTANGSQPRPQTPHADGSGATGSEGAARYTHFPPFRFSAEFPNPRLLKEKKRVYSGTVFYAGSLWNIYIQKVASSRTKQLGVYLHRAKERDTEDVIAGTAGLAQGSVDERIGQLERDMILGSRRQERRHRQRAATSGDGDEGESSGSGADEHTQSGAPISSARSNTMRDLLRQRKSGQTDVLGTSSFDSQSRAFATDSTQPASSDSEINPSDDDEGHAEAEAHRLSLKAKRPYVSTLPPYVDARPTIRTYFKIYSPSRGGRMLSVYESAPDKFNFSQSWGWKSSTLMLDDGLGDEDGGLSREEGGDGGPVGVAKSRSDGRLRFMVTIGVI